MCIAAISILALLASAMPHTAKRINWGKMRRAVVICAVPLTFTLMAAGLPQRMARAIAVPAATCTVTPLPLPTFGLLTAGALMGIGIGLGVGFRVGRWMAKREND